MKTKLKQLFVAGLTALALTYGCAKQDLEKLVLSESSKNKVVMFGESHSDYRKDNDFVIKILPELKKQGFNYFAMEVVRNPQDPVSKVFTDYSSGKITKEDINRDNINRGNYKFSLEDLEIFVTGWIDTLDEAKNLGMKIIFYDVLDGEYSSSNERDKKSFENLKEMIFDKDPDAKVIVYCGRRHLNEKEACDLKLAEWEKQANLKNRSEDGKFICLAYHLNEYTNGKVLTVSLIGYDRYIKYCDMTLDLDKNKCLKNKPYNKEE